VLFNFFIPKP